jgi:hypothetical protein
LEGIRDGPPISADLNIAQRGMNRAGVGFRVVVQAAGEGK